MFEPSRAQVGDTAIEAPQKGRERSKNQKKNKKMEEKEKSLFDPGRHFPVPYLDFFIPVTLLAGLDLAFEGHCAQ